jgi:tetratricopeptide (TPR) repeat protein
MSWIRRQRWVAPAALLFLFAAAGVMLYRSRGAADPPSRSFEESLRQARQDLSAGRYSAAEDAAVHALELTSDSSAALLIAAEAATRGNRLAAAIGYYRRVPQDAGADYVAAMYGTAEILIHQGRLSDGERTLRRVLRRDAGHLKANYRLAYLLEITGRNWESVPFAIALLRHEVIDPARLFLLGDVERFFDVGDFLEQCRKAAPDDPLPRLALARRALAANRLDRAEELLNHVVSRNPGLIEAQARLGEVLLMKRRYAALARWHRQLPTNASEHPEIWVVRGGLCRDLGDVNGAVRCFREAIAREPSHRYANYQLGQLLRGKNHNDLAAAYQDRARKLAELATILDRLHRGVSQKRFDIQNVRKVVELTESLGRLWEAWAWSQFLLRNIPPDTRPSWLEQTAARLRPRLRDELPRQATRTLRASGSLAVDAFPVPDWERVFSGISRPAVAEDSGRANVRFRDLALSAGIDFRYFNSADPSTAGARLFETTGGGVGVIDFDSDGWPDLYFTQGAPWPLTGKPHGYSNRLYRNTPNGRFRDETAAAGLQEAGFGQGVAVGDFDNDGFPDLYVANLGRNRLYRNNGDGTFSDATSAAGFHRADWTTSCLLADLNGDTLPDVYDVNYVSGDLSRICSRDEKPMACSPTAFSAAQDRVFLNRGDGRFEEATDSSGIVAPHGYGLGVVAADFNGSGRLSLCIANDQTPNFFFVNQTRPGGPLKFTEQAVPTGLATDAEGKPQGSMGIAAGDADGDGRLDLFVTNFYRESNTLYVAQPGGFFVDRTRSAGLRTASFLLLGFGTQFLDADLDGRPDLVLTNGHIDDLRSLGEPFEMPPQFFSNRGDGRFQELPAKSLGGYFQKTWRGRGLARLDWDRDGREDFVVSHIDAPAALVTNQTRSGAKSLRIQLRGTRASRDAIGTTVRITLGKRVFVQQLTAGDGYQASNQRQLVFGLGAAPHADAIEVRWPNGSKQAFGRMASGSELLIIEGNPRPLVLSKE